jgi:hypothetical protein
VLVRSAILEFLLLDGLLLVSERDRPRPEAVGRSAGVAAPLGPAEQPGAQPRETPALRLLDRIESPGLIDLQALEGVALLLDLVASGRGTPLLPPPQAGLRAPEPYEPGDPPYPDD